MRSKRICTLLFKLHVHLFAGDTEKIINKKTKKYNTFLNLFSIWYVGQMDSAATAARKVFYLQKLYESVVCARSCPRKWDWTATETENDQTNESIVNAHELFVSQCFYLLLFLFYFGRCFQFCAFELLYFDYFSLLYFTLFLFGYTKLVTRPLRFSFFLRISTLSVSSWVKVFLVLLQSHHRMVSFNCYVSDRGKGRGAGWPKLLLADAKNGMDKNSCNQTIPFAVALFSICVNNRPKQEKNKEMEPNEHVSDRCEISTCAQTQRLHCMMLLMMRAKVAESLYSFQSFCFFKLIPKYIYLYTDVCIWDFQKLYQVFVWYYLTMICRG